MSSEQKIREEALEQPSMQVIEQEDLKPDNLHSI